MDLTAKLRFKKTVKINPECQKPFTDLPLSDKTLSMLSTKGFELMTPVQSQSYTYVFDGEDVVARSRTGTGKTFAFGLPLVEKVVTSGLVSLRRESRAKPIILILEPTRELALQVSQELSSICGAHNMKVQSIYGGVPFFSQERALRDGVHVLVATPGRMLDHITRGTVDLSAIRHVVLDEGDTMLEMGFQKAVESIILNVKTPGEKARRSAQYALQDDDEQDGDNIGGGEESSAAAGKSRVQMLLFSATMPGWICKLTDKHMRDPIFLDAVQEGETRLAGTIKHYSVRLPSASSSRDEAVTSIVEDLILTKGSGGQTIVFTNTKHEADSLASSSCFGQLKSQVLHGDISQSARQSTIRQFKQGAIDVLVATDVAARGLDIAGVDLVLHTAPPGDADTYVHRAGRTGRAGRNGTSIVLCTGAEERKLGVFESALNFRFLRSPPPAALEIAEACSDMATQRLNKINPEVVKYFAPHATKLVSSLQLLHSEGGNASKAGSADDGVNGAGGVVRIKEAALVDIMARCLSAISNRNTITSR
jgi:ATP-dependent RNA helicase DDX21